jgi:hypothetical protein
MTKRPLRHDDVPGYSGDSVNRWIVSLEVRGRGDAAATPEVSTFLGAELSHLTPEIDGSADRIRIELAVKAPDVVAATSYATTRVLDALLSLDNAAWRCEVVDVAADPTPD